MPLKTSRNTTPLPITPASNAQHTQSPDLSLPADRSLHEQLLEQLGFLRLNPTHFAIGRQIIGSIEGDGYLRRALPAIADDLALTQNIDTTEEDILRVLRQIQTFDPPGIAARNLQECLRLQLEHPQHLQHKNTAYTLAYRIVEQCFELLSKKIIRK